MQSRPIPGSLAPIFALFAAALLFGALEARADLAYSVDVASPSFPAVSNSDVLSRPFYGVPPPAVVFPAAALGLAGAPADEIDAFTYGGVVGLPLFFSVDAASLGIPGLAPDVASEAAALQAAGDIFSVPPANMLFRNQDVLGEVPTIPPGLIAVPPVDNLDALDVGAFTGAVPAFFSLAAGNVYGLSGADILIPGPAPAIPAACLPSSPSLPRPRSGCCPATTSTRSRSTGTSTAIWPRTPWTIAHRSRIRSWTQMGTCAAMLATCPSTATATIKWASRTTCCSERGSGFRSRRRPPAVIAPAVAWSESPTSSASARHSERRRRRA